MVAAVLMISSEALTTSSAIDTTMIAMTCSGTRPPLAGGSMRGGGAALGGPGLFAMDGNGSSRMRPRIAHKRERTRNTETCARIFWFRRRQLLPVQSECRREIFATEPEG